MKLPVVRFLEVTVTQHWPVRFEAHQTNLVDLKRFGSHLLEPLDIDPMEQLRNTSRQRLCRMFYEIGLLRLPQQNRRILPDGVQYRRPRELSRHLAQDVDAFCFEYIQVIHTSDLQAEPSNANRTEIIVR